MSSNNSSKIQVILTLNENQHLLIFNKDFKIKEETLIDLNHCNNVKIIQNLDLNDFIHYYISVEINDKSKRISNLFSVFF